MRQHRGQTVAAACGVEAACYKPTTRRWWAAGGGGGYGTILTMRVKLFIRMFFFSTTPIYQSPDFCSPFSESLKRAASQLLESD